MHSREAKWPKEYIKLCRSLHPSRRPSGPTCLTNHLSFSQTGWPGSLGLGEDR